jgi:hypothetical protein
MLPTIGLSLVDLGPPRAGRRVFPPAPGGGELGPSYCSLEAVSRM